MADAITEVWVVRDPSGNVLGSSYRSPKCALGDAIAHLGKTSRERLQPIRQMVDLNSWHKRFEAGGYTLQRLPLATPEHAALVEAAMKFYRCVGQQLAEPFPLFESATFCEMMDVMRRIYHGHPLPTVKESLTDDAARAAGGQPCAKCKGMGYTKEALPNEANLLIYGRVACECQADRAGEG